MHAWVVAMAGLPWQPWGRLLECLKTGESAFEKVYGMSRYDYLRLHPDEGSCFDRAMATYQRRVRLSGAYDFSGCRTVVDLGGGLGDVLADVLTTHPHVTGVLVEHEAVLEEARANLLGLGVDDRCRYLAGDILDAVPPGGDVYILKSVLHNWSDEQALRGLRNCRAAMSESARLLVVEPSRGDANKRQDRAFMDLHMLVMHGGRERSETEMGELLTSAGLDACRVAPVSHVLLVEARRSWTPP